MKTPAFIQNVKQRIRNRFSTMVERIVAPIVEQRLAAMRTEIGEFRDNFDDEVVRVIEDSKDDRDLEREIEDALGNYDFKDEIENCIDRYNFNSTIEDALDHYDFTKAVKDAFEDDDLIAELVKAIDLYRVKAHEAAKY